MKTYFIKIVYIGMLFNVAPLASSATPENKTIHSSTKKRASQTQSRSQPSVSEISESEAALDCKPIRSVKAITVERENLFHSVEKSKLVYEIRGQSFTRSINPKYGESFKDIPINAKLRDIWPDKTGCNYKILDPSDETKKDDG